MGWLRNSAVPSSLQGFSSTRTHLSKRPNSVSSNRKEERELDLRSIYIYSTVFLLADRMGDPHSGVQLCPDCASKHKPQ